MLAVQNVFNVFVMTASFKLEVNLSKKKKKIKLSTKNLECEKYFSSICLSLYKDFREYFLLYISSKMSESNSLDFWCGWHF